MSGSECPRLACPVQLSWNQPGAYRPQQPVHCTVSTNSSICSRRTSLHCEAFHLVRAAAGILVRLPQPPTRSVGCCRNQNFTLVKHHAPRRLSCLSLSSTGSPICDTKETVVTRAAGAPGIGGRVGCPQLEWPGIDLILRLVAYNL